MIQAEIKTYDLSEEDYKAIYNQIVGNQNSDLAEVAALQTDTNYLYSSYKKVKKATVKVFAEIDILASGKKLITPAIPSVFDENQAEIEPEVPAVYFIPDWKTDFKAELTTEFNELFIIKEFVSSKEFDYDTQWDDFLDSYNT